MTVSQPFAYTTGALGTALDTIAYGYGDSQMAMGARIDFSDFRTGLVISNTSAVGIQSEVTNYTYI